MGFFQREHREAMAEATQRAEEAERQAIEAERDRLEAERQAQLAKVEQLRALERALIRRDDEYLRYIANGEALPLYVAS